MKRQTLEELGGLLSGGLGSGEQVMFKGRIEVVEPGRSHGEYLFKCDDAATIAAYHAPTGFEGAYRIENGASSFMFEPEGNNEIYSERLGVPLKYPEGHTLVVTNYEESFY